MPSSPSLNNSTRTEISSYVTRSWFGNNEEDLILTIQDGVLLKLIHTPLDIVEFFLFIKSPELYEIDEWPRRLDQSDIIPLVQLTDMIEESIEFIDTSLIFFRVPVPFEYPVYKATLDLRDKSVPIVNKYIGRNY